MSEFTNCGINKNYAFTAYGSTFEPVCGMLDSQNYAHFFHTRGSEAAGDNTKADLIIGIWQILKQQAYWLGEKLKDDKVVYKDDLKRQRDEINNTVLNGLEEKLKNAPYKGVSKEDLNHQTQEFQNTVLKGLDEKFKNLPYKGVAQEDVNKQIDLNSQTLEILKGLEEKIKNMTCITAVEKGYGVTQEDLNIQTQEFRNIVKLASRTIESQNDKILDKFTGIKARIEKIMNEDLDRKFGHVEKVIRECLEDVELRISDLKEQGRDIIEKVSESSGKTEIEKLVLENNTILKKIENEKLATRTDIKNIKIPGLEQLVKDELKDLEKQIDPKTLVRKIDLKQESILEKIEENHNVVKNFDTARLENIIQNQSIEIKGMLIEISETFEKMPWHKSVEEELGKAKAHLQNIAQLIGMETVEK